MTIDAYKTPLQGGRSRGYFSDGTTSVVVHSTTEHVEAVIKEVALLSGHEPPNLDTVPVHIPGQTRMEV